MDDATRLRRAATFGPAADLYDDVRPGYAAEAVAFAVPRPASRVLDLGAGTGKLTRALLAAGHEVVAVDPSALMLARLHARSPGVTTHVAAAEDTGLPAASFDAVTVGAAFHWFTRPAGDAEIARVLRPGGTAALLWNPRDPADPLAAALDRVIAAVGPASDRDPLADRRSVGLDPTWFGPTERAEFPHAVPVDAARLVGMVASRSYVLDLDDDRRQAFLADVARFTRDELGLTGDTTRPLGFRSLALRAVRSPDV